MKLTQLIKGFDYSDIYGRLEDFEVSGITCNSKQADLNCIFVAVKGAKTDGNVFIKEAIDNGAKAVVASRSCLGLNRLFGVPTIVVEDTRRAMADIAAEFYDNPSKKIKVIAVTGTNGKTTITYLVEAIIKQSSKTSGVIGTINYRFKDKIFPSKNTTPGPLELQSILAKMASEGVEHLIMEVSSHALDQQRTHGINFSSAIFTNLTQDHLDYHKNLEDYFQAKAKLFKGLDSSAFAVINNDDPYSRRLKNITSASIVDYGIESSAGLVAGNIKFDIQSTEFEISGMGIRQKIRVRLIGLHNIYNILAVVAWALQEGFDFGLIKTALENFQFVPGRLERVESDNDFSIFVDYAHTPDALVNVIGSLRQLAGGNKIIVVFGCGGERDKDKRPKMGKVVTEMADFALITSDNPRSEDPLRIIDDILRGVSKNCRVIADRKEAIRQGLALLKSGDIFLVAGKGHENYQVLNNAVIEFDDREVIKECLRSAKFFKAAQENFFPAQEI